MTLWIFPHVFKKPTHKPKEWVLVTKWVSSTALNLVGKSDEICKLEGHKICVVGNPPLLLPSPALPLTSLGAFFPSPLLVISLHLTPKLRVP